MCPLYTVVIIPQPVPPGPGVHTALREVGSISTRPGEGPAPCLASSDNVFSASLSGTIDGAPLEDLSNFLLLRRRPAWWWVPPRVPRRTQTCFWAPLRPGLALPSSRPAVCPGSCGWGHTSAPGSSSPSLEWGVSAQGCPRLETERHAL